MKEIVLASFIGHHRPVRYRNYAGDPLLWPRQRQLELFKTMNRVPDRETGNISCVESAPFRVHTARGLPTFQFRNWTTASKLQEAQSSQWGIRDEEHTRS